MSTNNSLTIPATSGAVHQGDVVTHLPGGAISMQFGKPEDSHDARFENEAARSGVEDGGTYRAREDGTVEKFGAVTSYQVTEPQASDDPFATAMNAAGSPTSRITRDTVLNFGAGQKLPIRVAMTLGWIR